MQRSGGRRGAVLALVALAVAALLAAILLPDYIRVDRYRPRVEASLSGALGRRVHMDQMQLQLLPLPAFLLNGFTVDARDGSLEPTLRAERVTARLRLLPLFRRRIAIARISLEDASLNLTRNADGEWNFDSLLQAAPQLPTGPTTQRQAPDRFPYVEVTNGRINIKRGLEKLPYSLVDADVAFWLESPTEWRIRLKGTPERTDISNSATGMLRMDGSIARVKPGDAAGWRDAGLHLTAEWRQAPLGQLSRGISGHDLGWRGLSTTTAEIAGTLREAEVAVDSRLVDVRREDFVPVNSLDMHVTCRARLMAFAHRVDWQSCSLPVGSGNFAARGVWTWGGETPSGWELVVTRVPAQWLLDAVRVLRPGVSPEMRAAGSFTGDFQSAGGGVRPVGSVAWADGAVSAPELQTPVVIRGFSLAAAVPVVDAPVKTAKKVRGAKVVAPAAAPAAAGAMVSPRVTADLGGSVPLGATVRLTGAGYAVQLDGTAQAGKLIALARLFGAAHMAGVRTATGEVAPELTVRGAWLQGKPAAEGSAGLKQVVVTTAWLPGTVTVPAGQMHWDGMLASAGGTAEWAGSTWQAQVTRAAGCDAATACGWQATAHTSQASAAQVSAEFRNTDQGLLRFFRGNPNSAGWPPVELHATADQLMFAGVAMKQATVTAQAQGQLVHVTAFGGQALGGSLQGAAEWRALQGSADVQVSATGVTLQALGAALHENFGRGTLQANTTLHLDGLAVRSGSFTATVQNAALAGVGLSGSPLEKFAAWQLAGSVARDRLNVEHSTLTGDSGPPPELSGTLGFDQRVDLTAKPSGQRITGQIGVKQ